MRRALVVLTCGALLTLVVEVTSSVAAPGRRLWALGLGGAFALVAIVGFGRVLDRGRPFALGYLAVQLPLGMAMFAANHTTVGAALLMTVLVMQTVLLVSLPVAVAVIAIVPLGHLGMAPSDGVRAAVGTLVATSFGAVLTLVVLREQRSRELLAQAHARLRGYATQAEQLATIQERNRLARDIHDGLGHHLTVVQMQLQAARAVLHSDTMHSDELLAKAQQQAEEALSEVRRSVSALREPGAVLPLAERLDPLVSEVSASGVATGFEVLGDPRTLSADAEEALYRTAQEGLTNVRKHAEATRARVLLDYRDDAAVAVEVRDDGRGVDGDAGSSAGFGLVGLEERAAQLGGRLILGSQPERGMSLRVEVPG